jgi:hypothetical protein
MRTRALTVLLGIPALLLATFAAPGTATSPRTAACPAAHGGSAGFIGRITDVRVGRHATFDRFVVQFAGSRVPQFEVSHQASSRFVLDPSGRVVTLRGAAGVRVHFDHATGAGSYSGPRDFTPNFPQLREARQIGDFEAVTTWGLGVRRSVCMKVQTLTAPVRIVVDVPH